MATLKAEYKDNSGYFIVRVSDSAFYYGNGDTVNGTGISVNQFLRFNPYMEYVGDKDVRVSDAVQEWIERNMEV